MTGPRDSTPVNTVTGEPLSDRQRHHLDAIRVAGEALYEAFHFAEGSMPPGEHQDHVFSSRRMNIAGTQLEIALMVARRAALETK